MVMKYAVSENSVISYQKQIKSLENKIKDAKKEKENLEGRVGSVVAEKGRLLLALDAKVGSNIALFINLILASD